jgi:hypothetical protein
VISKSEQPAIRNDGGLFRALFFESQHIGYVALTPNPDQEISSGSARRFHRSYGVSEVVHGSYGRILNLLDHDPLPKAGIDTGFNTHNRQTFDGGRRAQTLAQGWSERSQV